LIGEVCDTVFMLSSVLLPVFFGAALGNVIRGVPLDGDATFFLPLWTDFRPGPHPGVLDWYTVICGVVALVAIATHGANYLALRATGELNRRARAIARMGTLVLPVVTTVSLAATIAVRPTVLDNFRAHPIGLFIPAAVALSLVAMALAARRGREVTAFVASVVYLATMLGGAAFALFPVLLPSSTDPALSLTLENAATGSYAMKTALRWWPIAFLIVAATFVHLYRTFRGKIAGSEGGHY
jgi:cytochrome d ubiquinol oxidase subunit II